MPLKKLTANWINVKSKLVKFDRAGLLALVHDMYAANSDNQAFLHTRFELGGDALQRYKQTIAHWLWPELSKNQDISVAKAKKAITDYKKAIGQPEGLVELMVFYCEQAAGFSVEVGLQHDGYFNTLVRMFEQTLKACVGLGTAQRDAVHKRLDAVRQISHDFGYGVGDDMDELLVDYGFNPKT